MVDDPDVWRAAHLLVKRHGREASIVAAERADELLDTGDMDGCAIWKRILKPWPRSYARGRPKASG